MSSFFGDSHRQAEGGEIKEKTLRAERQTERNA